MVLYRPSKRTTLGLRTLKDLLYGLEKRILKVKKKTDRNKRKSNLSFLGKTF